MVSGRVITLAAFATFAYAEDSVASVVDSLVDKMAGRFSDPAPKADLDGTTLGKAAGVPTSGRVNLANPAGATNKAAPHALLGRASHAFRSPVLVASGEASDIKQAPTTDLPGGPSALKGRRAAMAGMLASMAAFGAAPGPAAAKRERAYDIIRKSGLQYETLALNLDKEAREVADKQPDLAQVIGASQAVALGGAIMGGAKAHKNGQLLEAQKKKVEERLKVEEALLTKLQAVHKKLNEERRVVKAREMATRQAKEGKHDEAYEAIRNTLKRGKDALARRAAHEAQTLFEQALMAAQQAGPHQSDLARKAMRGLAAAAQLAGDVQKAIKWIQQSLDLATSSSEKADTLGFMGDLYEAIGDYENAAKYYDEWLETVNSDDGTVQEATA